MFFTAHEPPEVENLEENGSSSTVNGNTREHSQFGFYFYFVVHNTVDLLTVILNVFVLIQIVISKNKHFKSSFYLLLGIFISTMATVGIVSLVSTVTYNIFGFHSPKLDFIETIIDIFTSYYSVFLVLLLSLNRLAIFIFPKINDLLFTRSRILFVVVFLGCAILTASLWFYKIMGISCEHATAGPFQTYAKNVDLLNRVNVISYLIPLSSVLCYIILYFHIRGIRSSAGNTESVLGKAETNAAIQGFVILIAYLTAMIFHIIIIFVPTEGILKPYMNGIHDLIESSPQLTIPIALISSNKEIKNALRTPCLKKTEATQAVPKNTTAISQ